MATSSASGRWRVRTARAMTLAIRASPLSRATSTGPVSRTRISGTRPGDGGQGDAGLPQRGKDLLDVAEEQRVGPDHQHALALEGEAVGVEQVGGPVEGHRRLARARAALDHQHPGQRGPDDLVLLALDGGDDVGHPARPGPVEGGQQGGRAADGQVAQDQLARRAVAAVRTRRTPPASASVRPSAPDRAEALVLQADHPAALEGQVAPEHQALGVAAGGPVERLGDRGPPVDHQGIVVGAVDGQPADVEGLGVRLRRRRRPLAGRRCRSAVGPPVVRSPSSHPVDPAEGQGLVADVQLLEAGQAGADDHVPLGPGLEGAPRPRSSTPSSMALASFRMASRRA